MSTLSVVVEPNPILHSPSRDIAADRMKQYDGFARDMVETMLAQNGIGLAAPQVGKNINLFVINKDVANTSEHLILCNPKITFRSRATHLMEEGCLSCPGHYGNVRRPEKIRVRAYSLDGKKHQFKAKGLLAKVFQHEIDHLGGVLILQKFES